MFGAYSPDPEAYPQQWPPTSYQRFARQSPHVPMIDWQPRHRRPTRGIVLVRWLSVITLAVFTLSRCGGLA